MKGKKITLILDESKQEEIQGYLAELLEGQKTAVLELELNELQEEEIRGKKVQFQVIDEPQGVFLYEGVVQYFLKHRLHIEQLRFVKQIQRRNDVKVPIDYLEDIEFISKESPIKAKVRFKDISAGGTCFEVLENPLDLEQGDLVSSIFKLTRYPIMLEMKVLRITKTKNETYTYGCQFVENTPEIESLIREFVFKVQVEKKKKEEKVKKEMEER